MKNIFLSIGFLLFIFQIAYSQSTSNCNCDVTLTQAGTYDNNNLKVKPGQTVCIRAGSYVGFLFKNFTGTVDQPIRFVNCGGQVNLGQETAGTALEFNKCSYFVLSGSGDSTIRYGFVAGKVKSGSSTVVVNGVCTNYEVERVEVTGSGYAGFSMRLEPGCDSMTYQPNFRVQSVKIHDNYIHDVPATAMFLSSGQSATNGVVITCNGVQKRVYPVQMEGLEVYNNRIEYIRGAGLTINNAPGASIHDNSILYTNLGADPAGWQVGGSADCGCDYTITQSGVYNNYLLRVAPGKTVCIKAGSYNALVLGNFIGTPSQPIRFVNCGGLVTSGSTNINSCLQFSGSRYVSLSGSGDPNYQYGIKLASATSGAALSVGGLSSDCEVDHVEIAQSGFAGMMLKTDPSCDSTTWRGNFTMYNVNVHDNYIHDTKGEGIYAGNSFYGSGMTVSCSGVQKQVYPHLIYGLNLHHNRIERTGAEGLQYGCAPDATVHHNSLYNTGIDPFAYGQANGLQISGGAGGDCYNNIIQNAAGMGIMIVGHLGNNRVFNNIVSQSGADGIFCDDRVGSLPGTFVQLINNTINGAGRDGIRLYNEINTNTIINNAISNWGSSGGKPIVFAQGATATVSNNYTAVSYQTLGYVNAANGDFTLSSNSPLIDAGMNASSWGVETDLNDHVRPVGNGYDIGAYEYVPASNNGFRVGIVEELAGNPIADVSSTINYPSPCYDQVTIRLQTGELIEQIDVYSPQGQLISQTRLATGQETVSLSTHTWGAGVYTYQIRTGSQVVPGRVVKL
ncbi:choice-of-anchor Q domain-containing protein [Spirosoma aerophilum]